jgi:deoxyribodipyrimidine photolyase-related protein
MCLLFVKIMQKAHIVFPHQLFQKIPVQKNEAVIYIVEEFLFFKQYKFHKQKLIFHRASMKAYEAYLIHEGFECCYIEAHQTESDIRNLIALLASKNIESISYTDVCDNWLEKRINQTASLHQIQTQVFTSPLFINTVESIHSYFDTKKRYYQTDFYIHQRKQQKILVATNEQPLEGKWTFDTENRLKYPKDKKAPLVPKITKNQFYQEATQYVSQHFPENYGRDSMVYPTTFQEAEQWLEYFLESRFYDFGIYEDAIVASEVLLHHSMLTPLLNVGLLLPMQVIQKAINYAEQHAIPYNSLEGFVRQILGWREFIRAIYIREGSMQRTKNFWGFTRKLPQSFYDGTTGIKPIDKTIQKLLDTGYNHHIERLMVLSNFMLLCEINPDDVYQWFMEMYIDAYDWVMVPNIYGMGQFADGGLMCTKPYISGSNYILKMSDYNKNDSWVQTWDALFWRFMHVHRAFFLQNPRLGMLVKTFDKMDESKRNNLLRTAEKFLENL